MKKSFKISIVLPGKQSLKKEGVSLQVPIWNGLIGIKVGRQPLVATMEPGVVSITDENGNKSYFATSGGFVEVYKDVVTLLCDEIIMPEDLNKDVKEKKFYTKDYLKLSESEKREYLMEMLVSKL